MMLFVLAFSLVATESQTFEGSGSLERADAYASFSKKIMPSTQPYSLTFELSASKNGGKLDTLTVKSITSADESLAADTAEISKLASVVSIPIKFSRPEGYGEFVGTATEGPADEVGGHRGEFYLKGHLRKDGTAISNFEYTFTGWASGKRSVWMKYKSASLPEGKKSEDEKKSREVAQTLERDKPRIATVTFTYTDGSSNRTIRLRPSGRVDDTKGAKDQFSEKPGK